MNASRAEIAETAEIAEKIVFRVLCALCALCGLFPPSAESAQATVTRSAILQAEDRRAPTSRDLGVIRSGLRSGDPQTAQIAVRALGRLERAALVPDILPLLKHPLPELREEAANALAQAVHRPAEASRSNEAVVDGIISALAARLNVEAEPSVRGAVCHTLGRVAKTTEQAERVEMLLLAAHSRETSIDGRLGIASGFETLLRLQRQKHAPGAETIDALRSMATNGAHRADPSRDVRIRRLALEALVAAGSVGAATIHQAINDPDPQVRRLAMRAAATEQAGDVTDMLTEGMTDASPMVRLEALRAMRTRGTEALCRAAVIATGDSDTNLVLFALDQLAACAGSVDALAILERTINDLTDAGKPRAWHRPAHAVVALAAAVPAHAKAALPQFTESSIWQMRMYGARAAAALADRDTLEKLARDEDDNVREAAVDGLVKVAGHAADAVYTSQLTRSGNQVLRAAALALAGSPTPERVVPALKQALGRLVAEGRDNSHDARDAIVKALDSLGSPTKAVNPAPIPAASPETAQDLRRLAAARARVTMRGLGTFEMVLFTSEAPATVVRFAHLAEAGYYNGLTFHRVVPNFVVQGGSPGASEYVGDAMFMRDETGLWPHVRGAAGISTRGRDTGDAQIFIDLVDLPRLDHEYTVFAQVLNGMDIVDQILEGDVIEKIEIVLGP